MTDRYQALVGSPVGGRVAERLGLPRPAVLRRYQPGQALLDGPALLVAPDPAELAAAVTDVLAATGAEVRRPDAGEGRLAAVVVDASGLQGVAGLAALHAELGPALRRLRPSGRVVLLGRPPHEAGSPEQAAARQALDGLTRSLAKEVRAGATANLVLVADGADGSVGADSADSAIESTLRFFLSARSAFVSGQVVTVARPVAADGSTDWQRPLAGRVAVVTGAAQGIGAAIATVLARDGATVVCADLPAQGERLARVANDVGGTALQLDITSGSAGRRIAEHADARHGRLDIVVHNAGITRDRLLANMDARTWSSVLAVNLEALLRMHDHLVGTRVLGAGSRVVCAASTSGIAGNRGQANYAASKAGVIGLVRSAAPAMADRGGTINAVAPGFIETDMTAAMPFAVREVARRVNSLRQGGLPVDVAETVAWLAQPASGGVNGQVVRVCGQSIVGA